MTNEKKEKVTWENIFPNPYPQSIFRDIHESDYGKISELLARNFGYPLDRLSGNIGRTLYHGMIKTLQQAEQEGPVCINPPSQEEIEKIIDRAMLGLYDDISLEGQSIIAKRIHDRIKNGG